MKNTKALYKALINDTLSFLKQLELLPDQKAVTFNNPVPVAIKLNKQAQPITIIKEEKKQIAPIKTPPKQEPAAQSISSQESYLRTMIMRILPEIPLTDHIPHSFSNSSEKNRKTCCILAFSQEEAETVFLKQLARGIQQTLADTKILDAKRVINSSKWEEILSQKPIDLLLVMEKDIQTKQLIVENSSTTPTYCNIPVLLISHPSTYAENPSLKRHLWTQICHYLN